MSVNSKLKDIITHWVVTGDDDYGGYIFAAPVTMKARWQDVQQQFINQSGEEQVSRSVVYVERDIDTGDWIALDDHTDIADPLTQASRLLVRAYKVESFGRSTNLRATQNIRKVFL